MDLFVPPICTFLHLIYFCLSQKKKIRSFCDHHCRFLYPIYPLICVAASAVIESFPDIFRDKYDPNANFVMVTVGSFNILTVLSFYVSELSGW